MKTTELIKFLTTQGFTDAQAYNLIVGDLFEFVAEEQVAEPGAQKVVAYFEYKITAVLLAAIRELKK